MSCGSSPWTHVMLILPVIHGSWTKDFLLPWQPAEKRQGLNLNLIAAYFLCNIGQMKTYWLTGKKGRCASDRTGRISAVPEELQAEGRAGSVANRRYSPVTMDDVTMARKGAISVSNRSSPVQLARSGWGRFINVVIVRTWIRHYSFFGHLYWSNMSIEILELELLASPL